MRTALYKEGQPYYKTPDRIEFFFEIEATNEAIHCIRFVLFNTPNEASFMHESINCRVYDSNNNPVKCTQIPVRERDDDSNPRDVCLFFEYPIKKGDGRFTIRFSEDVMDLMHDLKDKRNDKMDFVTTRQDGNIDETYFILRLPKEFDKVAMLPLPKNKATGTAVQDSDLNKLGINSGNIDFQTIGYIIRDADGQNPYGVDIRL